MPYDEVDLLDAWRVPARDDEAGIAATRERGPLGAGHPEDREAPLPGGPHGFCHACFSGDYPTAPPTDPDKLRFGCGC